MQRRWTGQVWPCMLVCLFLRYQWDRRTEGFDLRLATEYNESLLGALLSSNHLEGY